MVQRLHLKGVPEDRTGMLPNWVDADVIQPTPRENALRAALGIPAGRFVLLYSGNMGEKQGLDLIVEVARDFQADDSVLFLMCGDGAARARIQQQAQGLRNMWFMPLQPRERLSELLSLADIHLLPQRADAEDLVLPSKLTAIMASGRPVIATATPQSELGIAAAVGGLVVPPQDAQACGEAIRRLLRDAGLRQRLGQAGRSYALQNWERRAVLEVLKERLRALLAQN
jgi:colanic acid biosynthesis glycosyl transferase WcaI